MKKAFTLAEILIVLSVIGIITAILLPAARHITPDENALKFKKANATLGRVIHELVSSGEYYLEGDLGVKPDGALVDGTHDGDQIYLCHTIAQLLSTKSVNCNSSDTQGVSNDMQFIQYGANTTWTLTYEESQARVDSVCKARASFIGPEIVTQDNVTWYQSSSYSTFGILWGKSYVSDEAAAADCATACAERLYGGYHIDGFGFNRIYKIFCIDVDGINKGEDPFGYGIRADGKIFYGARATEWMEKSIQNKD